MTDQTHIEHCASCGELLNALNSTQSWRDEGDGRWYHRSAECLPAAEQHRLWKISQPQTD